MLDKFPDWGIASFRAQLIRDFEKGIAPDANGEDGPAHAIIEDLTESERRKVAKACEWLVLPSR
jgi:hypothetical protein